MLGRLSREPARPDRRRSTRVCQHAAMVANGPMLRLLPRLDDDVAFFWTSGEDGVLRLLHCNACGFFIHPPGPVCPRCLSRTWRPQAVSGRATSRPTRSTSSSGSRAASPTSSPGCPSTSSPTSGSPPTWSTSSPRTCASACRSRWSSSSTTTSGSRSSARGGGVVSPTPVEEPLERRAIISGIGQSDVGRRLGRTDLDLTVEAALAAIADAGLDPRRHRRPLDLPGHGRRARRASPARPRPRSRTPCGLSLNWHDGGGEGPGQMRAVIAAAWPWPPAWPATSSSTGR